MTLRIRHGGLSEREIAEALAMGAERDFSSQPGSAWSFIAQPPIPSRDSAYHIDWLLRRFADRADALRLLRKRGCRVEIVCFWESMSGNGGPMLDRELLVDLAKFPLDRLGFDFRIDEPPWGSDRTEEDVAPSLRPPTSSDEFNPVGGRTYVTLCLFHNALPPEEISSGLGLKPDRVVRRGTPAPLRQTAPLNVWFYGSNERLESADVGLHLDWLAQRFIPRRAALQALKERGCRIDIFCFWESAKNASGPALGGDLLIALSMLPLDEIGFDVYFADGNESNRESAGISPVH